MSEVGQDESSCPLSLMDVFEKACPVYMKYGMTYDQFWYGDISAHKQYRAAYILKLKQDNLNAWLQGRYIYDAMLAIAPFVKAFSKSKPSPYPKEPYDLTEEDRKEREEREARERYERIKEKVAMFADEFNKRRKEESKDG